VNFVNLSDLYYAIAPQAPGFNEVSAIDELRRAAREFCRESMASAETFQFTVPANVGIVGVEVPDSAVEPVGVLWIEGLRSTPVWARTLEDLRKTDPTWRTRTGSQAECFVQEIPDEVQLVPRPTVAVAVAYMRVCYQPTRTATKIDEFMVRHYENALIDGALYRILRMPNQTWSNPQAAQQAQERYEMAISRARADAQKNHTINTTEARAMRFLA
jgi:hypothetical protein